MWRNEHEMSKKIACVGVQVRFLRERIKNGLGILIKLV